MSNPNQAPLNFTASEIAHLLGRTRSAVHRALANSPNSGWKEVSGNNAKAWKLRDLPTELAVAVDRATRLGNTVEVRETLSINGKTISQATVRKAEKLREAMKRPLSIQHVASKADLIETGLREYERSFGRSISARQWERLFERTVYRDNGKENFERLELYVDSRQSRPRIQAVETGFDFQPLLDQISLFKDATKPTAEDEDFLFAAGFRWLEEESADCDSRQLGVLRLALLDFIWGKLRSRRPSRNALRMAFDRRHAKWLSRGKSLQALRDARANKGRSALETIAEEVQLIGGYAAEHCEGNVSKAYRDLYTRGHIPRIKEQYAYDIRTNKSEVPKVVRQEACRIAESLRNQRLGPWATRMSGPHIKRDWSEVEAGDGFVADDVTLNNYFYWYDEAGQLHIERGECLLMIDARSMYPVDAVLLARNDDRERGYNARDIRKLIVHAHDLHGFPRECFYFEKGIWAARMNAGIAATDEIPWRDTEAGLADAGVKVRHALARNPRGKPNIENVIGLLQRSQANKPGWVGRDEKGVKFERMQEFISRARRGKEHPANELLSMAQWMTAISRTLEEFAAEPQNGTLLPGKAPEQVWNNSIERRPLKQLPEDARYLIATHRREAKVRSDGITLKIGKREFNYFEPHLIPLEGQRVNAFFNLEDPSVLTISDMDMQFYAVKRGPVIPAMSAAPEELAEAMRRQREYNSTRLALYSEMRHRISSTIVRDSEHSPATLEFGRKHNQAMEEAKKEARIKNRKKANLERELEKARAEYEDYERSRTEVSQ